MILTYFLDIFVRTKSTQSLLFYALKLIHLTLILFDMKKILTFYALCMMTVSAYCQLSGSLNYSLGLPQQAMAKNINAVHQLVLTGGYKLPNHPFMTIGAEIGLGTYANLRVPTTLSVDNSAPTSTYINYSSNTFNVNAVVRIDLIRPSLITPYLTLKGGMYNFFSNIRVEDPQDTDGCRALESKSILNDNTAALTYGGGLRYQIYKGRNARYRNQRYIDFQITNTRGGTVEYINTKKLSDHQHHSATTATVSSGGGEEVKPLEMKFINVQSKVVHNHKVAEVFKTPLRLLDIRIGYFVAF
jgi:hypothetical protein